MERGFQGGNVGRGLSRLGGMRWKDRVIHVFMLPVIYMRRV